MTVFQPKLRAALRGYNRERLLKDVGAGLTVGVVALPLAMAFAIASGLKPETGLFTAIIAGFLISLLGGSRVQVGGPAGAFIVIVYGIVQRYGVANLVIATAMSGVMLLGMGLLRMGTLVRFIPVAVIIGFTNGIAVLIALSQIKDFLGLSVSPMPADFAGIVETIALHASDFNPWALGLACACLALLVLWQLVLPRCSRGLGGLGGKLISIPGAVVVLVLATLGCALLEVPVQTIGSRFGGIPSALPALAWPDFRWDTVHQLLMPALTLAVLGAIESLLCARVADGMIGDRHDPNQELMAQGIANLVTPFFGGMPATGTIARTVTNVKSGANTPVAGMVHALTLLVVILVAAPLAFHIPLPALSAILVFVAWNMGDWRAFAQLQQFRLPYRSTLLAVFLLTVLVDLTVAVEVGLMAACLTFVYRISSLTRSECVLDTPQLQAHRLHGAVFFGAVQLLEHLESRLPHQALVLDWKNVMYLDSSGAEALHNLLKVCQQHRVRLVLAGLSHQPLDILQRTGFLALLGSAGVVADLPLALAALNADTPQV
jgi:SulP family sulfate permease